MADPFLGEIRIFGFSYAPYAWATCNGALVPLRQQSALYTLLGTTYGGDGSTTFQLPNLAARGVCNAGQAPGLNTYALGQTFGDNAVTLTVAQIASHSHQANAYEGGSGTRTPNPATGSALSATDIITPFVSAVPDQTLSPVAITPAGGGQPHENRQPGLPLMFCICMSGNYPVFP